MRNEDEIRKKIAEMQNEIEKLTIELKSVPDEFDPFAYPRYEPKEYYDLRIGELQRQVFLLQWALGRY